MLVLTEAQNTLKAKLSTGLHSFSDLPANEKLDLAAWLIPASTFDQSHKLMMQGMYLLIPEDFDLSQINSGRTNRIASRTTIDGIEVTNVSLLTDMAESRPYYWARQIISDWKIVAIAENNFPSTD
ncbi:MAG: hypothetical protein AAGA75_25545 [Cyanobacteria bacterium P01_E01_bin.6]